MKINYFSRTFFPKTPMRAPNKAKIPPITSVKGRAGIPAAVLMKVFTSPKYPETKYRVNKRTHAKMPAKNAVRAFLVSPMR